MRRWLPLLFLVGCAGGWDPPSGSPRVCRPTVGGGAVSCVQTDVILTAGGHPIPSVSESWPVYVECPSDTVCYAWSDAHPGFYVMDSHEGLGR
jgi:hypothetical protein